MVRFGRQASCAAAILLATVATGGAQTKAPFFKSLPQLDVRPKKPLPSVQPNATYAVDIDCKPASTAPLTPITDDALIRTTYTTAHAVLISTQQANSSTVSPGTLPSGGLGMTVVYVTDGTKGGEIDNRKGCRTSFVVRRQKNLFLIPFISLHTANQAGLVTSIFAAALTPFASLFSLVTGGPLAADAASRITDFQNVESSFNTMLAQLNRDFDYAQTVSLGVGTTTITTSQSVTTVTVRPLAALINDKIDDFSSDLRTIGDSETVKVTQAAPEATCAQLSNNLALDGITAPEDRAYILGYEGLRILQSKNDMMHCLGRLVKIGAGLPQLWDGQPTMTVTPAMAEDFYTANFIGPQQLPFKEVEGTLDQLMRALGQYAKNGQPPSPESTTALGRLFAGDASLVDSSFAGVFKSAAMPTGVPAIVDFMIARGYYHFGCFAQISDQTGAYADNANSIFLAFKAPPDATSARKAETLAIHPIFADSVHTIATLNVSDNVDWVSNVLANRSSAFDCNGFQVQ